MRGHIISLISNLSIRFKILFSSVIMLVLVSLFISFYYPLSQKKLAQHTLENKVESMADMVAMTIGIVWMSDNYQAMVEAMNWLKRDKDLSYMVLYDSSGTPLSTYNPHHLRV
ncbi:MAG: hypothetical protein D6681_07375, partial [Calditrichaeota bacterium]